MKNLVLVVFPLLLCGCSTAIKFSKWSDGEVIPSTGLRFALQDSSVTFAPSAPQTAPAKPQPPPTPNGGGKAMEDSHVQRNETPETLGPASKSDGKRKLPTRKLPASAVLEEHASLPAAPPAADNPPLDNGAKPVDGSNCPSGITNDGWYRCFNQVNSSAIIAPLKTEPGTPSPVYVASPDDASHWYFSTTSISGTNITGQDALYSQITIKYTNNAGTIIGGAGSGAVTGFGIAGPYGGLAGLLIGGVGAAAGGRGPSHPVAASSPHWVDYLCSSNPVDLSDPSALIKLSPALYLPLTIKGVDGRPFAPSLSVDSPKDVPSACWHALPNARALGNAIPMVVGGPAPGSTPRLPEMGDGWLYRFVTLEDTTKAPSGAQAMDNFLGSKGNSHQFPFSSCRKVTIEITWWKDLYDAISDAGAQHSAPTPRVLAYDASIADPKYVNVASVKKGGVINFKPDCGATVSSAVDTSNVAAISAAATNAENIYKAEQSWEASKKK